MLRRQRRFADRARRQAGISLPVARKAYRVTLTVIEVPQWARDIALKTLSGGERHVWLRSRQQARKLALHDHRRGGAGAVDPVEYRRCQRCQRLLLGAEAAEVREWIHLNPASQPPKCGEECR